MAERPPHPSSTPVAAEGLTAGQAARYLGVAVTTLRSWHRRYGLGPAEHVAGHHRRYGTDDLVKLEIMRTLTARGVPAAEAARMALSGARTPAPARAGGGAHAVVRGRASTAARGLASAALRLDTPTVRRLIEAALAERGVVDTWEHLLAPVLAGIGARHADTGEYIEVEHLLSRTISQVLAAVRRPAAGPSPRVLLACAEEEQHSLPLEALAAALAERGLDCRLLGARVPAGALRAAVARTGPAMVLVWSHAPATADPAQLRPLLTGRAQPPVVAVAGPGWLADLPPGVLTVATLSEAVDLARSLPPAPPI